VSIKLTEIQKTVTEALIEASTTFKPDQIKAYEDALKRETNINAKLVIEKILENAFIANNKKLPICDDTGIPQVLLDIGSEAEVEGNIGKLFSYITNGIVKGLRSLPGRPMAVQGNEWERLAQTNGLYDDPGMLLPPPIRIKSIEGNKIRLTVLMLGGGPEIRSRTYRIFHHHEVKNVSKKIVEWAIELASLLGCTPCVPSVGIGRTHYEATCLMLDALANKSFGEQNDMEEFITSSLNKSNIGTLGLGGKVTALNTFVNIGPQRASGVRIVSLRIGCCIDPRRSSFVLH
jgi:fumarate hydratase subunit alpha